MNIMRANPEQLFEYGPFTVRRQRPGEALSPLVSVDLMTLKLDARIPMQEHRDEEVFTYLWRGSMLHQDRRSSDLQPGGEAMTQVLERDQGVLPNGWTELAGPEASDAPLELRQNAYIYDALLERGQTLEVPKQPGLIAYIVVLEGVINIGDQRLGRGDAASDLDEINEITGERDANLICFLVKPDSAA